MVKLTKRIGSLVLTVFLLAVLLLPMMGFAAKVDNERVFDIGSNAESVVAELENGVLKISGVGDTKNYTVETAPFKHVAEQIEQVEIETSVTSIGDYLFYNCFALTEEVTLPEKISYIGEKAFSGENEALAPSIKLVKNMFSASEIVIDNGEDSEERFEITTITEQEVGNEIFYKTTKTDRLFLAQSENRSFINAMEGCGYRQASGTVKATFDMGSGNGEEKSLEKMLALIDGEIALPDLPSVFADKGDDLLYTYRFTGWTEANDPADMVRLGGTSFSIEERDMLYFFAAWEKEPRVKIERDKNDELGYRISSLDGYEIEDVRWQVGKEQAKLSDVKWNELKLDTQLLNGVAEQTEENLLRAIVTVREKKKGIFSIFSSDEQSQELELAPVYRQQTGTEGRVALSFSAGTGTGLMPSVLYRSGDKAVAPPCSMRASSTSESFAGWVDDFGKLYDVGDMVEIPNEGITLTALWSNYESVALAGSEEQLLHALRGINAKDIYTSYIVLTSDIELENDLDLSDYGQYGGLTITACHPDKMTNQHSDYKLDLGENSLKLSSELRLENITLRSDSEINANGNRLTIGENVTMVGEPTIIGAGVNDESETLSCDLRIFSGSYDNIYGVMMDNDAELSGDISMVVAGNTSVSEKFVVTDEATNIKLNGNCSMYIGENIVVSDDFASDNFSCEGTEITIDGSMINTSVNLTSGYENNSLRVQRDVRIAGDINAGENAEVVVTGGELHSIYASEESKNSNILFEGYTGELEVIQGFGEVKIVASELVLSGGKLKENTENNEAELYSLADIEALYIEEESRFTVLEGFKSVASIDAGKAELEEIAPSSLAIARGKVLELEDKNGAYGDITGELYLEAVGAGEYSIAVYASQKNEAEVFKGKAENNVETGEAHGYRYWQIDGNNTVLDITLDAKSTAQGGDGKLEHIVELPARESGAYRFEKAPEIKAGDIKLVAPTEMKQSANEIALAVQTNEAGGWIIENGAPMAEATLDGEIAESEAKINLLYNADSVDFSGGLVEIQLDEYDGESRTGSVTLRIKIVSSNSGISKKTARIEKGKNIAELAGERNVKINQQSAVSVYFETEFSSSTMLDSDRMSILFLDEKETAISFPEGARLLLADVSNLENIAYYSKIVQNDSEIVLSDFESLGENSNFSDRYFNEGEIEKLVILLDFSSAAAPQAGEYSLCLRHNSADDNEQKVDFEIAKAENISLSATAKKMPPKSMEIKIESYIGESETRFEEGYEYLIKMNENSVGEIRVSPKAKLSADLGTSFLNADGTITLVSEIPNPRLMIDFSEVELNHLASPLAGGEREFDFEITLKDTDVSARTNKVLLDLSGAELESTPQSVAIEIPKSEERLVNLDEGEVKIKAEIELAGLERGDSLELEVLRKIDPLPGSQSYEKIDGSESWIKLKGSGKNRFAEITVPKETQAGTYRILATVLNENGEIVAETPCNFIVYE